MGKYNYFTREVGHIVYKKILISEISVELLLKSVSYVVEKTCLAGFLSVNRYRKSDNRKFRLFFSRF